MVSLRPARRTRFLLGDERGMALIMVVGTASVLAIITGVIAVQSVSNLRQAGNERTFERSLHVADAGVDHMLFLIKQQKQEDQTDLTTGEGAPPAFASLQDEEDWVLDQAFAASDDPGRLVTTREGDWIAMRPEGEPLIYSVGYVPSFDAPRKIRVVRAEYDFAPFSPGNAILTDGDLDLYGSANVSGSLPNAHGNGNVVVQGGTGIDIEGYVSASGTFDDPGNPDIGDLDNSGPGTPIIEVPSVDPRANYSMSEYDLCPDGSVKAGPSYDDPALASSSATPCEGDVLALDGDNFLDWDMQPGDPALWSYSGNGDDHGVFYIYQGSANIGGNIGTDEAPWRVTVFAEAEGVDGDLVGGDIDVSGRPIMSSYERGEGLGFVAGRDLEMSGNPGTSFEGVHAAHEQFDILGSSTLLGAVIAEDADHTGGSPAGPTSRVGGSVSITFNGASVPLGSNIRTTLWLEI